MPFMLKSKGGITGTVTLNSLRSGFCLDGMDLEEVHISKGVPTTEEALVLAFYHHHLARGHEPAQALALALADLEKNLASAVAPAQENPHLGKKLGGIRVNARGWLRRIQAQAGFEAQGWFCEELLKHLQELGDRFYAGDIKAVDEFLQLYCLDEKRPK